MWMRLRRERGVSAWGLAGVLSLALCILGVSGDPAWASGHPPATQSGFGFVENGLEVIFKNEDGSVDTQAGSHPFEAFAFLEFNNKAKNQVIGGQARNVEVNVPPGYIGDPGAVTAQCTRQQLDSTVNGSNCPIGSVIGEFEASLAGSEAGEPVYNMVPPPGVPAQFGFSLLGNKVLLNVGVRSASDYGITFHADNNSERGVIFVRMVLKGAPGASGKPFLTLPTSCAGPQEFSASANTWEAPSETANVSFLSPAITGCEHLNFNPSISAAPDTSRADTPAGLTVDVKMPQEGLTVPGQLAESDIKAATVTLPAGVAINPGQAAGLAACRFSENESENESAIGSEGPAACPAASRVGTVKVKSPLLETAIEKELEGNVYVLQSQSPEPLVEPPNLLLLIAASGDGIDLKLVASVHLDEATGQLTAHLGENPQIEAEHPKLKGHMLLPQFPFTDFKLAFSGGAQAALVTPPACGVYGPASGFSADFTPSSTPFVGDAFPTSSFGIESGPEGTPCPASPRPFAPSMIAGSTTDQAGGYTDFSLLLQNGDGQQRISSLQFKLPPGLLAMISQVPLCPEPQASQGACSSASRIGHTVVAAGPGPFPLVVPQPGEPEAPIYLTGPYKGAPYGLSIAVPLVVGPFNLGTEVVRSRIEVDPHTAQATITTDPLPQIVKGVPSDLRTINAVVDRRNFTFNPTNCNPMSFSGTAAGTEGASAPISSHFQVGSCRTLKFKPDFKVSTSGRTSRKNGASLEVKVLYPTGTLEANQASSQANIRSVKVELPKRLPSRLTTLQKACLAAVFEANPASCPAASVVGHATAVSPVLPGALTGPAYFVSHGGEAFPSLVVVLQGDNVTVDLEGTTFISKKGITSSTFKSVPDVPIASFDLALPQGPFSALAANGNLCKGSLVMPTEFVAQNGAEIREKTKIAVGGCAKATSRHGRSSRKHAG